MTRVMSIVILIVAALAASLAAEAQPAGKVARIGFLRAASPQPADIEAFRHGLRDLGHIEGQHVTIEQRYAAGIAARLPDLAAEVSAPLTH
jgi:putative tryptophan/tyrosine transport system substrate-binding protein